VKLDDPVVDALQCRNVKICTLSRYYLGPQTRHAPVLGYGAVDLPEMCRGHAATASCTSALESADTMNASHTSMIGIPSVPKGQFCPQFRNDSGVKEIHIGVREFECIGATPPQDHPHVYLEIGNCDRILCPYCSTMFHFDPSLHNFEADPPESLFRIGPQ
jgi:uncharacterized Zn-finger protein